MRTLTIEDVRRRVLDSIGSGPQQYLERDSLEELFAVMESELMDNAPQGSRALWSSLGYNAEVTHEGERWTLRAFPGGWSAKCARTGAFTIRESENLQQAMLDAEKFIFQPDCEAAGMGALKDGE